MEARAEVVEGVSAHTFSEGALFWFTFPLRPMGCRAEPMAQVHTPKSKVEKHRVRF